jgi:hypothetical protein
LPPEKNLKSFFPLPLQGEAGGRGASGAPPADPVNKISSDVSNTLRQLEKSKLENATSGILLILFCTPRIKEEAKRQTAKEFYEKT